MSIKLLQVNQARWVHAAIFLGVFVLVSIGVAGLSGARADNHAPGGASPEKNNVTAAVPAHWPPQFSLDENGKPTGFAIDIMEAVAARAGLTVTYVVKTNFLGATIALDKGEVDLIPNYGLVPERLKKQNIRGTAPVETFRVSLFVRNDTYDLKGVDDLVGRRLGVVETNIGQIMFGKRKDIDIQVSPDIKSALFELLSGRTDALIYPNSVIESMARKTGLEDRIKIAGPPLREIKRGIVVRKESAALLARLNKAVESLVGTPDYQRIYTKWYGNPPTFWTGKRVGWTMGAVLAVLVAIILGWHFRTQIRLNRSLRESEERFRTLVEATTVIVWVTDPEGEFTEAQPSWQDYTGQPWPDHQGFGWTKMIHPEDIEEVQRLWEDSLKNQTVYLSEGRIFNAEMNGYRHFNAHAAPLFNSDGSIEKWIGTIADITDRKRAEEALIAAKDEAERANNAKSEFLSSMSHELRTPLNAVLGFTQLLNSDPDHPLTSSQIEATEQVLKSGDHLLNLIEGVLDLSHIESDNISVNVTPKNPTSVIESCAAIAHNLASQSGLRFYDRTVEWVLPEIGIDETRFQQVLLNLLSNAVKYNRDDGTVTLGVEARTGAQQQGGNGLLRISVTDTGIGIAEENKDQVFEAFSRLGHESSNIAGTGIGLTITKNLVEAMGGTIGFESTLDMGSTFWVAFPIVSGTLMAKGRDDKPATATASDASPKAKHTILYVEDNPSSLKLMELIISRVPFAAMIAAHTGELGVDMAEIHRPDLIFLDINLPGMNGFEALKRLKASEATKNIPVVALTARASGSDREHGLKSGFDFYLTKPFQIEEISAVIQRSLR